MVWFILDARRFSLMRYADGDHVVFDDQMHKEWLTGIVDWARRWQHWGARDAIGSSTVDACLDFRFI